VRLAVGNAHDADFKSASSAKTFKSR